MEAHEFDAYLREQGTLNYPIIHVRDVPGPDRTLVFGCSRVTNEVTGHQDRTETVHVYKRDGLLCVVTYTSDGVRRFAIAREQVLVEDCAPKKRAYPERCDLDFARLMRSHGTPLEFTRFDAVRTDRAPATSHPGFYGLLIEDTTAPR